jgi:hypothetical protein
MAAAMSATVFYADPANEVATLQNVFKVGGVPTDATLATVTVTDPTGATTTPAVTHVSTGTYSATVPTTLPGIWLYKWVGTGTASDVQEGTWTAFTLDNSLYCTVEELKSRLGITDTQDDFELTIAVQAASRAIDKMCRRYFWRGTDTRTYVPQSIYAQQLDDLVSVTTLKMDRDGDGTFEETWTLGTDFALTVSPGRYNTAAKGEQWPYTGFTILGPKWIPYTWLWSHLDRIQVVGVFGWPAVPANIKSAALIAAAQLFKIKDAPFGVAGFGEFGAVKVSAIPQVAWLVQDYIAGQRVGV